MERTTVKQEKKRSKSESKPCKAWKIECRIFPELVIYRSHTTRSKARWQEYSLAKEMYPYMKLGDFRVTRAPKMDHLANIPKLITFKLVEEVEKNDNNSSK